MRRFVKLEQTFLSSLAHEASTFRGLKLEEIIILCIDPNSEWAELIKWLTTETTPHDRTVCCVTDKNVLKPILEALPELQTSVTTTLPPNNALLIALGKDGVYVCHIEAIPPNKNFH